MKFVVFSFLNILTWPVIPTGLVASRAIFTHGLKGPGPKAANFQGRHIKKNSRLKYGMQEKKGCS
jgi:hypothetical protein